MIENELIEWIQLINTDGIGPVRFYKLLEKYGSAKESLAALKTKQTIFSRKDAEYEFQKARRLNVRIVVRGDKDYPENFLQLNDAPPVLYVKGRTDILNYPATVAIVGARNASVNGRKIASRIAYDLTENEVVVVSGMARGIDSAAHKGALYAKQEHGTTIAVLGTGVDVVYPLENQELYEQICARGTVISEYLPGTQPQAANFPRRNRLVSALSAGTLVVEASLNSGSLITARLALEQGKDIFAVPGSPLEGRSAGCNQLIRDGAYLTESAEDILNTLALTQNRQIKAYQTDDLLAKPLDKGQKNDNIPSQVKTDDGVLSQPLVDLIPGCGIDVDELIRLAGQDTMQTMTQITELELDGIIERINGNVLILKDKKSRKN